MSPPYTSAQMAQAVPIWAHRQAGSLVLLNRSPDGRAGEEERGQKQETSPKAGSSESRDKREFLRAGDPARRKLRPERGRT